MRLFYLFLLIIFSLPAFSQRFWLTTYEFPYGPKTGIAGVADTCLFVSTTFHVLRSFDQGQNFPSVLKTSGLYSIHATADGAVVAGGWGKVFHSPDFGQTWDSVSLGFDFPIVEFAETPDGGLFAISHTSNELGYVGGGVWHSADQGRTWQARNNGLPNHLATDQIAVAPNGWLLVTLRGEAPSNKGGLFLSENKGLQWQKVSAQIRWGEGGMNEANAEVNMGLSVTQDSVFWSFSGAASRVALRVNLSKALNSLKSTSKWTDFKISNTANWWEDFLLNDQYQAQNGDRYSSLTGSMSWAGSMFKKTDNPAWAKHDRGLGLDLGGKYNAQSFYELSNGKIFMVQFLDERIYWADTSRLTNAPPKLPNKPQQVAATPLSASEIRVSWGRDSLATHYEVQIATDESGPFALLEQVGQDTLQVTADGLEDAETYFFRVVGRNAAGISPPSNVVSATTPPLGRSDALERAIALYPNPARSAFAVELTGSYRPDSDVKVAVFTLSGQKMLETGLDAAGTSGLIPVESLPSGLYVVRVFTAQVQAMKKLWVE